MKFELIETVPASEVESTEHDTSAMVEMAKSFQVASDEDVASASTYLKAIADSKKSIETRRQFFVRPLNNQVASINDLFKRLSAPLLEADRVLREKVETFRAAQAAEAAKEAKRLAAQASALQKKLDEEAAAQGVAAPMVVAPAPLPQATSLGNVSIRKVWRFEVEDMNQVPREFLVVDESAIRRAVMAGAREIAGVRIYQGEQIAVR